jgi:thioesterase domain-containing protein
MRPTGSNPPLFVVPGNVGNVFTDLGDLARYLGPDQPFYGLQDGPQNPVRIEAVSLRYLEEIRRVQREGPYLLAGVCSGAIIAFEMAQRLQSQGQEVPFLAMIEPSSPSEPGPRTYLRFIKAQFRRYGGRLSHHAREMMQLAPAERGQYSRLKLKVLANRWASRRYAPQPYPGRIDIYLTEASLRRVHNRQSTWSEYAIDGAQVHEIPGTHATVVGLYDTLIDEAHMRVLADKMNARIKASLADGGA